MKQRQTTKFYLNETSSFSRQTPAGTYVNETSVPPGATQYVVTGPTTGTEGIPSEQFNCLANGPTDATVTVTDGGAGGTFSPSANFPAVEGSFTYTAPNDGTYTLTFTNNRGLVDPSPIVFTSNVYVPPATISLASQSAPQGQSVSFNVTTTNATTVRITLTSTTDSEQFAKEFSVQSGSSSLVYDSIQPDTYSVILTAIGSGGEQSVAGNNFTVLGLSGGGEIEFVVPDAPTDANAIAGSGYIDVYFTPPVDQGSNEVLDYLVTSSTGQTAIGETSPIRVTAQDGVKVTANVRARSAAGYSAPSVESNEVTPVGNYVPSIVVPLVTSNSTPIQAGITLSCAWFDQANPELFTAPTWKGQVETTGGDLTISLPGSQLTADDIGWLILTDSDGDPTTIHNAFSGPVVVQ